VILVDAVAMGLETWPSLSRSWGWLLGAEATGPGAGALRRRDEATAAPTGPKKVVAPSASGSRNSASSRGRTHRSALREQPGRGRLVGVGSVPAGVGLVGILGVADHAAGRAHGGDHRS